MAFTKSSVGVISTGKRSIWRDRTADNVSELIAVRSSLSKNMKCLQGNQVYKERYDYSEEQLSLNNIKREEQIVDNCDNILQLSLQSSVLADLIAA